MVTNALNSWINYSIRKFLPGAIHAINKIKIISAREKYEKIFPTDIKKWKENALLSIEKNVGILANIIVVSDSHYDLQSARKLAKYCKFIV